MNERAENYSGGDAQFSDWLNEVDQIVKNKIWVSLFDLTVVMQEDMLLKDAFDSGETPKGFVGDTVADVIARNYGAEFGDLLLRRTNI